MCLRTVAHQCDAFDPGVVHAGHGKLDGVEIDATALATLLQIPGLRVSRLPG